MPDPAVNRRLSSPCALAAIAFLSACAAAGGGAAEAETHYRRADYFQAYQAIERARASAPDDPAIERAYWRIRQAYLLAEAQRLVFLNREPEALEHLEKVLALDPENEAAARWRSKALAKLARRAVDAGDDALSAGELQAALVRYDEALRHEPGNAAALEGLERLGVQWKGLQADARGHFLSGLRALGEHAYARTRYHLGLALDKDPTLTEAREPAEIADRQVVEQRLADARAMEDAGLFGAALHEYRQVEEIAADHPEVASSIARAEKEIEAESLLTAGEVAVYRDDFEEARKVLTQALELTTRQHDRIAERLLLTRERELDHLYLLAKDLELQRRLEDAKAAFGRLDQSLPGYRDVRARIADLELRIGEATTAYDAGVAAEAEGRLEDAVGHLTDVQLFWQGFRDSRERLARLKAELAARDDGKS